jgi:predicted ATP-grasp superfamily ATP-dependent carboligase
MRILVFEYITGGGLLNEALPETLAREGDQMLQALAIDLARINSIDVVVTRDNRLPSLDADVQEVRLCSDEKFDEVWAHLLKKVDAVWPIAPETDALLERICDDVIKAGIILLNSSPACVNLAASKQKTLLRLAEEDIPVVPTFSSVETVPQSTGPWVVKPDDGVGCEGLRLYDSIEQAGHAMQAADGHILQPYLQALDLSLSLICEQGSARLLSVNRQQIRRVGDTLMLEGCVVNAHHCNKERFVQLAEAIAQAIPELWGYVGVDLLQCKQGVKVLEINPRLTSSYAVLSKELDCNPAKLVLDLLPQAPGDLLPYKNVSQRMSSEEGTPRAY